MSKSRGNVINPDEVVAEYGADSLRLYEMFMGPLEAVKPWSMKGVEGVYRFLGRAWRMIVDADADEIRLDPRVQDVAPTPEQAKVVARTIAAVTDDIEALRFNTAISRLMEFVNAFTRDIRPRTGDGDLHAAARAAGPARRPRNSGRSSATSRPWPTSPGRRSTLPSSRTTRSRSPSRSTASCGAAWSSRPTPTERSSRRPPARDERIAALLEGKTIRKVVVVPGKLVNFVVG